MVYTQYFSINQWMSQVFIGFQRKKTSVWARVVMEEPLVVLESRTEFYECAWLVAQLYPALCNPMDCSPPGSSVHGILQARILEWVAISFSRGSSWPWDRTQVSCIAGEFFTVWATREMLKRIHLYTERKYETFLYFRSVQFSCSVVSYSLQPHGL